MMPPEFNVVRAVLNKRSCLTLERGFTLAEAVIVIVITGIISAIVVVFIRMPVQGYVDSVARAEMTDVADTALRRMARDLRLALPNSIRVTANGGNQYIELLLTKTGGRYLAEEDYQGAGFLSWTDTTPTGLAFTVVGAMPSGTQAIVANDWIVVYNLGPGLSPADAYDCTVSCNRAQVAATPALLANSSVTLSVNTFALQPAASKMTSPTKRFQVVTTPVTYVCDLATNTIKRYDTYAIQAAQPNDMAAAPLLAIRPPLLATNVTACAFNYTLLPNTHSGLVGLTITLGTVAGAGGQVVLSHQVHVDNTP